MLKVQCCEILGQISAVVAIVFGTAVLSLAQLPSPQPPTVGRLNPSVASMESSFAQSPVRRLPATDEPHQSLLWTDGVLWTDARLGRWVFQPAEQVPDPTETFTLRGQEAVVPVTEYETCETCGNATSECDCSFLDRLTSMVSAWEKWEVSGHVRARHETNFERIDRPTRNRGRLRARLALTYTANEEVKGGIRWTTGDRKIALEPDDRSGSPLSYQDTGDIFDKFEFNLDRIFITYSPHWLPEAWFTGGKFKNPIKFNPIFDSPVGDLVWDEAAQPEGIAGGIHLA